MITVRYGGKRGKALRLKESPSHLVVRTKARGPVGYGRSFGASTLRPQSRNALRPFESVSEYVDAGVEVLRLRDGKRSRKVRDDARKVLKRDPALEFAGRVLVVPKTGEHVLYTENFFVKFDPDLSKRARRQLLSKYRLSIKRELGYAPAAYFVEAAAGTGQKVFGIAEKLLAEPGVELCHPELVRDRRIRQAFDEQWHLKRTRIGGQVVDAHANVEAAWELSQGDGVIIAVIDDGVDVDHEELRSSFKLVAPRDVTRGTDDPRPKGLFDRHGTACAGVACAAGLIGASGVAPRARLMPIRFASQLGSQAEADAFVWAADHGADVISCSWGPPDGDFLDDDDPRHTTAAPLPDSTRLAIDYAATRGRDGRGAVIFFAAGNGHEPIENDGYASHDSVIAVAACDDRGKAAPYSDFGAAVFCSFPSNHYFPSLTPGIWTTDRTGGLGYNEGRTRDGDPFGNYTNSFGGTSSACPGAAGVAALVLSRNPELSRVEVREILGRTADPIDPAGGAYEDGRSPVYGFDRLNARRAVEAALPPQPAEAFVFRATRDRPIRDFSRARLSVQVGETRPIGTIEATVVLDHTWIGDLVITLRPPRGAGLRPVVLQDQVVDRSFHMRRTFTTANTPALASYLGASPAGRWTLDVVDGVARDEGILRSFEIVLGG